MPHSKRVSPEGGGDSDRNSQRNGNSQNHGEEPGPAPNSLRRDENSISFRHFLQPQSDVVPSRHRPCRGASAGSVDLVDGASMALPDFVQDHLAADGGVMTSDQQNTGAAQQDAHHLGAGIPDYANLSSSSHEYSSQRSQHYMSARNGRPDGNPVSNGDSASSHGNQAQIALPDFLSDGPMLCNSNNALESGNHLQSISSSPLRNTSSSNSTSPSGAQGGSRNERESLMRQIEQLTRELEDKNRSIYRLERDLRRQQNETSMLETAYLNAKQSLQAVTRRAASAESRVADLEMRVRKNQSPEHASRPPSDGRSSNDLCTQAASFSAASSSNGVSQTISSHEVMDIAFSTEFLVGELMEQVQSLKRLAMSTTEEPNTLPFKGLKKEKNKPKPDGNSK